MNRKAIINIRATEQDKIFLQDIAQAAGYSNLTNFIITAAKKEAYRILNDMDTTYVSEKDWKAINELIANPPEANDYLKQLLSEK